MDKRNALKIVEGLRAAQAAKAAVFEIEGDDARNFGFVKDPARKVLLGTFGVEAGKKFFVSIASTPRSDDDFQFHVFEKFKANSVLTTIMATDEGMVWSYSTSKQSGDNLARKKAFLDAAKGDSITIPFPTEDISAFATAVNRAIALRHLADGAGGPGDDEGEDDETDTAGLLARLFENDTERHAAAVLLATTVRIAHAINPKSWCVTNPGGGEKIRVNVGVVRVLDLVPGMAKFAVDGAKLDAAARARLGDALDLSDDQRLAAFEDNGLAELPARSFGAMPEEVRIAHAALVERAATSTSPFARHHNPEVLESVETALGESLPRPAAPTVHYWKIAPGEDAAQWNTWREGGFIAIGWNKLGDLTNVTRDEFKKLAEEKEASGQVWKFRNIEVGDRVVANDGFFRVLGIGTVTGPYRYVPNAPHTHQLPVQWDDTRERQVEMKGWRATLIRLNQDAFKEIEAAPVASGEPAEKRADSRSTINEETELGPEGGIDFDDILAQLASRQLSFSAELVASYLLALQAKRFVLLSGISGTGKTRLAQEIARTFGPTVNETPPEGAFEMDGYMRDSMAIIIPPILQAQFKRVYQEGEHIEVQVVGKMKAEMKLRAIPATKHRSIYAAQLSGEIREWFLANIKENQRFFLSRKTQGDNEWLDVSLPTTDGMSTYELVAVRPDWTDSRGLIGFYNPLTKSYLPTPTLRLLLRAHAEVHAASSDGGPRPFFLIFDEMNLARVEHYFSDFLSAMESGEAIHLHDDPQVEEGEGIPRRITIPKNVFVIGTVNIDETTYMFSPKVLDRAFVLEFNDVDLGGLAGPVQSEAPESTPLALVNLEGGLKLRGQASSDEWKRFESCLGGEARALFGKIHDALAIENRHFGYRVARDVARFVDLAVEQAGTSDSTVRAAFDVAVLAKILPKLHGSQAEIEATLKRLLSIATGDKPESEVFTPHGVVVDRASLPLPRTARKLGRMLHRLRANGFVSFIE